MVSYAPIYRKLAVNYDTDHPVQVYLDEMQSSADDP